MTTVAIQAKGLQKSFGDVEVVTGVDFEVGRGEIFAVLGSNGTGKTTTINILSTPLKPDGGSASVGGYDTPVSRTRRGGRSAWPGWRAWP